MLHKSFAFALLAAVMVAPTAAFADQVAGSTAVTNQGSVNKGLNNTSGQSSTTNTVQRQVHKVGSAFCDSGNQTAAATAQTNQNSKNIGRNNVTGHTSTTNTIQTQVAKKIGALLCH